MTGKKTKTPLNAKQQSFVVEYLKDLNATQAAVRAGYSKKTAGRIGGRLLKNVRIASEIQQKMDERSSKAAITAQQILENIIAIGDRCMQRWPKMVGSGKDRQQAKEWVTTEDGEEVQALVFQFDSMGALRAQELLGKHLKLFTDKVEVAGQLTLEQLITGSQSKDKK